MRQMLGWLGRSERVNVKFKHYRIEWSEEDGVYIAYSVTYPLVATHGDTEEQALRELKRVVEDIESELDE